MFSDFFSRVEAQGGSSIEWKSLTEESEINQIIEESKSQPVLIFKHSTSCGTSAMALDRLERNWKSDEMSLMKPYFLDLLSYRSVSNKVADVFDVWHQSPQVLIIKDGKCIYEASHMGISYPEVRSVLEDLKPV